MTAPVAELTRLGNPTSRPTWWRTWRSHNQRNAGARDVIHRDRCPVIRRQFGLAVPWHAVSCQPLTAIHALVAIDDRRTVLCAVCIGGAPLDQAGATMASQELARTNDLAGMTIGQQLEAAEQLANAGLLPDSYRRQPANVLLAMQYASMQQIPTMAAILGVHVIEGRQSPSADLVQALVRRAGHRIRVGTTGQDKDIVGWAEIVRRDDPTHTYRAEWTIDRAEKAGLTKPTKSGKPSNWMTHPTAMVKRRALTEAAHDACPEVLLGLDVDRDLDDIALASNTDATPADDIADAEIVTPQTPATPAPDNEGGRAQQGKLSPSALHNKIKEHAARLNPGDDWPAQLADVEAEFAQMYDGQALRNATPDELAAFEADLAARVPASAA